MRGRVIQGFLLALLLAWVAAVAQAQRQPTRTASATGAVPPPDWARSLEVVEDGAVLRVAPEAGADRRGTVQVGTRLPLERRFAGEGCPTEIWFQVGTEAYVCEDQVRYSREDPGGTELPVVPSGRLLPNHHAFIRVDGTRGYAHPADYATDQYVEAYGEGFSVVVTDRQVYDGVAFVKIEGGLWVVEDSVGFVRGSDFEGVALEAGAPLDLAWVTRRNAPIYEGERSGRVARRAGLREVVHVEGEAAGGRLRLRDGAFVRARDVARAKPAPRPSDVGPDERWIDVDVEQQVMVAYQGDRPVYATLVSTGRPLRTHRTPEGQFRIWVKLATSDMDNLERTDVEQNYMIQSVPWVQYFEEANGFHATFWHDSFGRRRSHGCVNLSPKDARWLFRFTRPALPPGWYAILPTERQPGTLVRVRAGD